MNLKNLIRCKTKLSKNILILNIILLTSVISANNSFTISQSELSITKLNWATYPLNSWGYHHVEDVTETIQISRGEGAVYPLEVYDLP